MFKPTETKRWTDPFGLEPVAIEIQNDENGFAWRLVVEGEAAEPTSNYAGIHSFKDWYVATACWEGVFPEMTPFRILPIVK